MSIITLAVHLGHTDINRLILFGALFNSLLYLQALIPRIKVNIDTFIFITMFFLMEVSVLNWSRVKDRERERGYLYYYISICPVTGWLWLVLGRRKHWPGTEAT